MKKVQGKTLQDKEANEHVILLTDKSKAYVDSADFTEKLNILEKWDEHTTLETLM